MQHYYYTNKKHEHSISLRKCYRDDINAIPEAYIRMVQTSRIVGPTSKQKQSF